MNTTFLRTFCLPKSKNEKRKAKGKREIHQGICEKAREQGRIPMYSPSSLEDNAKNKTQE